MSPKVKGGVAQSQAEFGLTELRHGRRSRPNAPVAQVLAGILAL